MTTRNETATQGYGYAGGATHTGAATADSSNGMDVIGILLAVVMILGPLAAGAFWR